MGSDLVVTAPPADVLDRRGLVITALEQAARELRTQMGLADFDQRVRELVETVTRSLAATATSGSDAPVQIGELLTDAFERFAARARGDEKPVPVPWRDVAGVLGGGLWPGVHYLVAATGIGKTSFTYQWAKHAAGEGVPVLYIDLELSDDAVVARLASLLPEARSRNLHASDILRGNVTLNDVEALSSAASRDLAELPMARASVNAFAWDYTKLAPMVRAFRARHHVEAKRPVLVVLDYLQIVTSPDGVREDLRERIGKAAYQARGVAKNDNVAVLVVSSLARSNDRLLSGWGKAWPEECAPDGTGLLDLVALGKESGEVEYSADTVIVMARARGSVAGGGTRMRIGVAKQRAGKPGETTLVFNGSRWLDDEGRDEARKALDAKAQEHERKKAEKKRAAAEAKKAAKSGGSTGADKAAGEERPLAGTGDRWGGRGMTAQQSENVRLLECVVRKAIEPVSDDGAIELLAHELFALEPELCAEMDRAEGAGDPVVVTLDEEEAAAARIAPDSFRLYWRDAALVRVVARINLERAKWLRDGRAAKRRMNRYALWSPPFSLGLAILGEVLWDARVRERWEEAKRKPPALARFLVHDRLISLTRSHVDDDGTLRDQRGEVVEWFDVAAVDPAIARRGVGVFGSTVGHRLIRFCALEAHAASVRGKHRPEQLAIAGGFVELARRLGCDPTNLAPMRSLLAAGQCVRIDLPGRTIGGLWTWDELRAAPGRRASLDIHLSPAWLPGYATDLRMTEGRGAAASARRRLVPVLRNDPPHRMLSNPGEWGRAWTVAAELLVQLVDQAAELARSGSVQIDEATFARLLDEAGLARSRLEVVRSGLLTGDGQSPALLSLVGRDRYTLAESHAAELAFIVEGGSSREARRNRARKRNAGRGRGRQP